jgi:hypothetical protein
LYHLASEKSGDDLEERQAIESLLCKAAGELTLARLLRPEEGRASLYLYEVWSKLDQRPPATGGLLLGEGGLWLGREVLNLGFYAPWWARLSGLSLALLCALLFAWLPASRAASMAPVVALRPAGGTR